MGQIATDYLNKKVVIDSVMLSEKLNYPIGTASTMLMRLFKRGLTNRSRVIYNGRRFYVYWTGNGIDYGDEPPEWVTEYLKRYEKDSEGLFNSLRKKPKDYSYLKHHYWG